MTCKNDGGFRRFQTQHKAVITAMKGQIYDRLIQRVTINGREFDAAIDHAVDKAGAVDVLFTVLEPLKTNAQE